MDHKTNGLDRRSFLKKGLLGAAGLGALSAVPASILAAGPQFKGPKPEEKKGGYIYRTLGKTGITLPIVSMGVMNSDNENLIRAALDGGILHLDAAHGYMRGRNEETIGRFEAVGFIGREVTGPSLGIAVDDGTATTLDYTLDRGGAVNAKIISSEGKLIANVPLGSQSAFRARGIQVLLLDDGVYLGVGLGADALLGHARQPPLRS